jgi:myo-inositol-1(or 4)-monophosphatase
VSQWAEVREEAEVIARAAGALLRDTLRERRTIAYKDEGWANLVTDADRASEELILSGLSRRFPGDAVLAEESGGHGEARRLWLVDPLDGTVNYAHGVPHFCVSMALEADGALVVGVVYDPMRDELFSAAVGQGATLNGEPLSVSAVPSLARALVCTGFPYDLQAFPEAPLGLFNRVVLKAQGIRRPGAAALELAWLAAGRLDGFFEFGLKPWDTAAGALLITEAGGVVRSLDGRDYSPRFPHIVAAPPPVAAELVAECAAFYAGLAPGARRLP